MSEMAIRPCTEADFDSIWEVINDGAQAFRGVIPPDRLRVEIADGKNLPKLPQCRRHDPNTADGD